jgi:hypothetical protein
MRRLEAMLNDLVEIAPPDRRIVLEQELRLLTSPCRERSMPTSIAVPPAHRISRESVPERTS